MTGALYKATALLIVSEGKFHHALVPLWGCQTTITVMFWQPPPHTHTHTPTHTPYSHPHTHAGIERSLLYTVSQVPIRKFSAAALSVAVGCWQWLLTKRPDLEYPVSYVLQCVHITNRQAILNIPLIVQCLTKGPKTLTVLLKLDYCYLVHTLITVIVSSPIFRRF